MRSVTEVSEEIEALEKRLSRLRTELALAESTSKRPNESSAPTAGTTTDGLGGMVSVADQLPQRRIGCRCLWKIIDGMVDR